jgi:hypothetical protein
MFEGADPIPRTPGRVRHLARSGYPPIRIIDRAGPEA